VDAVAQVEADRHFRIAAELVAGILGEDLVGEVIADETEFLGGARPLGGARDDQVGELLELVAVMHEGRRDAGDHLVIVAGVVEGPATAIPAVRLAVALRVEDHALLDRRADDGEVVEPGAHLRLDADEVLVGRTAVGIGGIAGTSPDREVVRGKRRRCGKGQPPNEREEAETDDPCHAHSTTP